MKCQWSKWHDVLGSPNAVVNGRTLCERIDDLMKAGCHINDVWDEHMGHTPLILAISHASDKAVRALLAAGADPNQREGGKFSSGRTPLHFAVSRSVNDDSIRIVAALIKAGARVNATDLNGDTTLHDALDSGNDPTTAAVVELLLCAGANPTARNTFNRTPLQKLMASPRRCDIDKRSCWLLKEASRQSVSGTWCPR